MLRDQDAQALADFDRLPASAYVALPVVVALFGSSPATVWKWVKEGRLPSPRKFGPQTTRWNVGHLRGALAAFAEAA